MGNRSSFCTYEEYKDLYHKIIKEREKEHDKFNDGEFAIHYEMEFRSTKYLITSYNVPKYVRKSDFCNYTGKLLLNTKYIDDILKLTTFENKIKYGSRYYQTQKINISVHRKLYDYLFIS
jgi:hypothetical protein